MAENRGLQVVDRRACREMDRSENAWIWGGISDGEEYVEEHSGLGPAVVVAEQDASVLAVERRHVVCAVHVRKCQKAGSKNTKLRGAYRIVRSKI